MQKRVITSRITLGAVIRDARKKQGLTQIELGTRSGFDPSTIVALESGTKNFRFDTVARICGVLGLEILIQVVPEVDPWKD
ncbi:MAG: helix-turn-helix transcriptional regulator [Leptospiraceae bacterium]|nr:helix-turn-helix transcriptional regulator [Leptospiraceae bacterium]